MVNMGMCDDDRIRRDGAEPLEPIGAAVDHDPRAAAPHQLRTVHLVGSATDLRIPPRSEDVQPGRRPPMSGAGDRKGPIRDRLKVTLRSPSSGLRHNLEPPSWTARRRARLRERRFWPVARLRSTRI